jgi:transcriptional regulator with XRE-family HTH domain
MLVADLIRYARTEAGLSQAELAARCGTSQEALSAYERGRKDPSMSTASRILAAAGWTIVRVPASEVWSPGAAELDRRGRILAQVVDLAERLPAKKRPLLPYPPLHALAEKATQ